MNRTMGVISLACARSGGVREVWIPSYLLEEEMRYGKHPMAHNGTQDNAMQHKTTHHDMRQHQSKPLAELTGPGISGTF